MKKGCKFLIWPRSQLDDFPRLRSSLEGYRVKLLVLCLELKFPVNVAREKTLLRTS